MKKTLGRRIEKSYLMLVGIISLFLITGYFSYAYFTLQTEQKNRISIIAGTLNVEMKVDGTATNKLTVQANTTKEFTVTIKNVNDRTARYNFYYTGTLASGVEAGYVSESGKQIPPEAKGVNINASGTQTYKIKVKNGTSSSKTINLVSDVGLDYNDLVLPSNGHLFEETSSFPDDYTSSEFKKLITSIVTKGDKTIPSPAIKSWTIGNSVVYVEEEKSGYKLTIGANGKTILKADSSSLFSGFTNVITMDLSYLDTSKVTDMSGMFRDCSKLTTITGLENWNTTRVTDMSAMFSGCSRLTNLNLSGWKTSSVKNMLSMFFLCSSLETITGIENFDTSNVEQFYYIFNNCRSLQTLNLKSWNTSKVTDMSGMFRGCGATITGIENWVTSKVTNMNSMFSGGKFTVLDLSNWDTSKVKDMSAMFNGCDATTVNLSGLVTSSVTDISAMFYMNRHIQTITGLDTWDISNITDMSKMFYECLQLTTITGLEKLDTSKIINMSQMFYRCTKLTATIRIRNVNVTKYSSMFTDAATDANAKITVDYISEASSLVDAMIETASSTSHVVKGSVFTPEPSVEGEV